MHVNMHEDLAEYIAENFDINTLGVSLVQPSVYDRKDRDTGEKTGEIGMSGDLYSFAPIPNE